VENIYVPNAQIRILTKENARPTLLMQQIGGLEIQDEMVLASFNCIWYFGLSVWGELSF
jgi:hypothetical protein